jgi:hypothetical protein
MYRCVVAMLLCPASSASTRTPTPLLAKRVINVRLPLCELASRKLHVLYMLSSSWHIVLALKKLPFWLQNSAADGAMLRIAVRYCASLRIPG